MKHHDAGTALLERAAEVPGAVLQLVPTLDYTQMRMLAECTAGLGNNAAAAFVSTGSEFVWLDDVRDVEPTQVLVPASNTGKYPPISQVTLSGTWTPPPPGTAVSGSVDAVQAEADALFWSDSAVQKFVVPFVASCTGANAASVLERLQGAWNAYPTGSMGMFALMHRAPAHDEALGLDTQLAFVQANAQGVGVLPLGEYAEERSVVTTPPGMSAPFQSAVPAGPFPDYQLLRAMAEWAGSLNEGHWYFTVAPGMQKLTAPSSELPRLEAGQVMIPVHTPAAPSNRPSPASVLIQPVGGEAYELLGLADAVFWSTGSIQQFLLPYYASVRGMEAPAELQTIVNCWMLNIPGIGNELYADVQETEGSVKVEVEGEEEEGDLEVFALVHLPMSAWMTIDEEVLLQTLEKDDRHTLRQYHLGHLAQPRKSPLSALRQVGVLHRHRGRTHLLTVDDFTVLHPV